MEHNSPFKFKWISDGRDGTIVLTQDGHSLEIYWEMSGSIEYHIALAPVDLRQWQVPANSSIIEEQQLEILYQLREWLKSHKVKSDLDLPITLYKSNEICRCRGCDKKQLQDKAYCLYHYDLTLLMRD